MRDAQLYELFYTCLVIFVISIAPIIDIGLTELSPIATTAARVGAQNCVSGLRKGLQWVHRSGCGVALRKHSGRTTVYIQNERILFPLRIVYRVSDKAFDVTSIFRQIGRASCRERE